ncbi:hypothetical protein Btru_004974 [Bulinus truncatus]|nr:hypothetical protein Btru_004974 [Bulinus truncatus]
MNMKLGLDESGNVISEPFDSLIEVLQWNPESFSFNKSVLLQEQKMVVSNDSLIKGIEPTSRPQMLVCHDMCGGYLDDRFCQGCNSVSPYRFYHWQLIDTFVYFSHHFITIPPVGWIKAAHKHGVSILGTIITEWETGENICKEMLQSDAYAENVATKLAQMALTYGFNGWLINIENKIEADLIPRLQNFVHELTSKCRAMLDAPKVLWYDSVISSGELKWQNELNDQNEMFFQVCDGIFLNYCITNEHLTRSKLLASSNGRQFDVYVGIDAFGRGTPGGGGFNCKEALKMIQEQGLSCALFAPAWTYEKHCKELFDSNEIMFWGLLCEMMSTRTVRVPFTTSFCQGYGDQYFLEGQVLSDNLWFNLSLQQIQPTFTQSQFVSYTVKKTVENVKDETGALKDEITVSVNTKIPHPAQPKMKFDVTCGYIGGGCLKLSAKRIQSQAVWYKLFKLDSDVCQSLEVSVVWKASNLDGFGFALALSSVDRENAGRACLLLELTALSPRQQKYIKNVETDPIIFLDNVKSPKKTELKYGFIESTFKVNTAKFAQQANYRDNLFILSAVLVPHDDVPACNDLHMSVHLGNLSIHESSHTLPSPTITNIWCWNMKTELPLSGEDLHKILTNPLLNINQKTKTDNILTSSRSVALKPIDKSLVSVSVASYETQNISSHSSISYPSRSSSEIYSQLYILKWLYSSPMNMDYILVSSYDHSGRRKLLGQTVGESFVCSNFNDDNKPVSFSIQPIISFTNSPGKETVYTCCKLPEVVHSA